MTVVPKIVTAEELLAMGDQAKCLELWEGELRLVSPTNFQHGDIAVQIAMLLRQTAKPGGLGKVLVEVGFILRRNPDTVLGPDVSFVRQSRIPPAGELHKFFDGAPDLAVEIISPRNPRRELETKMSAYITCGTKLGWLVDPNAATVDVYCPDAPVRRLRQSDVISAADILPGFSCQVAEFFV